MPRRSLFSPRPPVPDKSRPLTSRYPVPLPVAIPAVAAGAAYLNARAGVGYDTRLLSSVLPTVIDLKWRAYRGRLNLFYRLEALATAKSSADRPFILFEDQRHTYAQAYDRVLRYGNWLRTRMGVEEGQIVALDFQNTDQFVFLFMALWAIGAKPAFINYNLTGPPLVHCIKKASTKLMLYSPEVAEQVTDDVRRGLGDVRFEVFGPELVAEATATDPVRFPDEVRADETEESMAVLIYTSGTTGLPKAAIVSWAKVAVASGFTSRFIGMKSSDVYYIVSAMSSTVDRAHPLAPHHNPRADARWVRLTTPANAYTPRPCPSTTARLHCWVSVPRYG